MTDGTDATSVKMPASAYTLRSSCASCGAAELRHFLDFGAIPLAGDFPREEELDSVARYPLGLAFCGSCSLVQATGVIDRDVLFRDYRYLSSVGLSHHFENLATRLWERYGLKSSSSVVEMGSNDGVFLAPMAARGCQVIGFEPAANVAKIARDRGCNVINDYFSASSVRERLKESSADLFVAANCFAHIDAINDVVEGIGYVLKPRGHAVIEVHDVRNLVDGLQYDFVYLEHSYYYSLTALQELFGRHGLTVVAVEEIPVHGGSMRVHVRNERLPVPEEVAVRLEEERHGVASWECFTGFADAVEAHKAELMALLAEVKANGHRIVGYGASGRANVLCNYCGIKTDLVEYIVDESPERVNRFVPGVDIPIRAREYFEQTVDEAYMLIFAWNYSRMIIEKIDQPGRRYIIPFPRPHVIEGSADIGSLVTL